MKRRFSLLLAVILMFHLTACGANGQNISTAPDIAASRENSTVPTEERNAENEVNPELSNTNILIAYFSVTEDVDTDGVDAVKACIRL